MTWYQSLYAQVVSTLKFDPWLPIILIKSLDGYVHCLQTQYAVALGENHFIHVMCPLPNRLRFWGSWFMCDT